MSCIFTFTFTRFDFVFPLPTGVTSVSTDAMACRACADTSRPARGVGGPVPLKSNTSPMSENAILASSATTNSALTGPSFRSLRRSAAIF